MTTDNIISVHNLHKRYDSFVAVEDISFDVGRGEIFGLLGPNGAGKTTTLGCIEGVLKPDGGHISVDGYDPVGQPTDVKRRIGVQLQATSLLPELTVYEQIRLFMQLHGQKADPQRIEQLIEQFGIGEKRNALPDQMSGGQQQRLALALALVSSDSEIVIFDEPSAGLDPQSRRVIWDTIRALRDGGKNGHRNHTLHGRGREAL